MEKYKVRAIVEIEVLAKNETAACEVLEIEVSPGRGAEVVDVEWHLTDAVVVPYVAPDGIGVWAHGAKKARFCEGGSTNVALVFPDDPGAWWWSNGHVMLRCEGSPPNGPQLVRDRTFAGTANTSSERAEIAWSAGRVAYDNSVLVRFCRLEGGEVACMAEKYFRLVNSGAPDAWRVGGEFDPIHALKRGQIIAVVMPVRYAPGDIVALNAPSAESEGRDG